MGGGKYAKLVGEKSAIGTGGWWGLGVGGGLTRRFWAVFEGGWGDLFLMVWAEGNASQS